MPALKNFNPPAMVAVDVETWRNVARGGTSVKKVDHLGNIRGQRILPGGTITITPYERRINHDYAATTELDPFLNGRLTPVRLLDDEEDTQFLKANPNNLGEDDLKELFKLSLAKLTARLAEVSNPIVLERVVAIAEEQGATIKQLKVAQERLEAVQEKPIKVQVFADVLKDPAVQQAAQGNPNLMGGGENLAGIS